MPLEMRLNNKGYLNSKLRGAAGRPRGGCAAVPRHGPAPLLAQARARLLTTIDYYLLFTNLLSFTGCYYVLLFISCWAALFV